MALPCHSPLILRQVRSETYRTGDGKSAKSLDTLTVPGTVPSRQAANWGREFANTVYGKGSIPCRWGRSSTA
jgi:hypothetical protein